MFNIVKIEETTTVMDHIKNFDKNTILIANKQTKGRGKGAREWISNKSKNLYMAINIDTNNKNINYSNYCFLSALSIVKSIKHLVKEKIDLKIKWPNDILLNNKKICGILLENDIQKNLLVIGIGVNINNSPEIKDNVLFSATNLEKENYIIEKDELINIFVNNFEYYSKDMEFNGFKNIRSEMLDYCYNLNKNITVKNNNQEFSGIFLDINQDGTLVLKVDDVIKKIHSGDIF